MPELPEVETTRRGIEPHLVGCRTAGVIIRNPHFRWPIPDNLEKTLVGQQICSVERRAKYLLLNCEIGTLIIHLGMSGSLRLLKTTSLQQIAAPQKHDHFDLVLDSGAVLRLRDPRRFGAVLWEAGDAEQHPLLSKLGPEPLSEAFNAQMLYQKTRGLRMSIKVLLMSNRMVVGVGNIYANEALFQAGIKPNTAASRIGLMRYINLTHAVKEVLVKAIEAGGSSLRDFVSSDGKPGYFQQQYWVYGRTGQSCRKCSAVVKQMKQGQRSSFYCPSCQR